MKLSITDFFSECDQIRKKTADLVTFTEEIRNGQLHFLCSAILICLLQVHVQGRIVSDKKCKHKDKYVKVLLKIWEKVLAQEVQAEKFNIRKSVSCKVQWKIDAKSKCDCSHATLLHMS